jgi:hypothetical protein
MTYVETLLVTYVIVIGIGVYMGLKDSDRNEGS